VAWNKRYYQVTHVTVADRNRLNDVNRSIGRLSIDGWHDVSRA
jgi:hypothetical protein